MIKPRDALRHQAPHQETEGTLLKRYYEDLTQGERATILMWVRAHLRPIKTTNYRCTCTDVQALFQASLNGFPVTIDMVRGAMLESGYTPHDHRSRDWYYNVGQHSMNATREQVGLISVPSGGHKPGSKG